MLANEHAALGRRGVFQNLATDLEFIIFSCKQRRTPQTWKAITPHSFHFPPPLLFFSPSPPSTDCVLPPLFYFPITSLFVSVSALAAAPYADGRLLLVWSCIRFYAASGCVRLTRYSDTPLRVAVFVFNTQSPPPSLIWSRRLQRCVRLLFRWVGGAEREGALSVCERVAISREVNFLVLGSRGVWKWWETNGDTLVCFKQNRSWEKRESVWSYCFDFFWGHCALQTCRRNGTA